MIRWPHWTTVWAFERADVFLQHAEARLFPLSV